MPAIELSPASAGLFFGCHPRRVAEAGLGPVPIRGVRGTRSGQFSRSERIRAECAPLPGFELECAHTDEGDPWCIVYDRERELVVLHIARIDSRYVMARASHSKPLTGVIVRRHKRGFG